MDSKTITSTVAVSVLSVAVTLFAPTAMPQKSNHPSWQTIVAADGTAAQDIENYVLTLPSEKDGHQEVMTLSCVKQPCHLFKKGDTVTLTDEGFKKIGSRFHNEREAVLKICGASTGCFEGALDTEKNSWLLRKN